MPPQPPIDMGLFRAARQNALTPAERTRLTKANFVPAPDEKLVATPDITPEQLAEQIAEETHNGRDRFQDAIEQAETPLTPERVPPCVAHDAASSDYSKVETIRASDTVDSPNEWTAREALVDLLGQIDRGEINVTDMLLFYRVSYPDGEREIGWSNVCTGDSMVLAGLAAVAQYNVAELVAG